MHRKVLSDTEIKRLNRTWRRRTVGTLDLVLCGLANPYNVGSILRTAAVLGVRTVHLIGATPGPDHPGVGKTGLGTEHKVHVARHEQLADAVAFLRTDGVQVMAVELASGAEPMHQQTFAGAVALVIGNEGHGLSPALLALCDRAVYLPQVGRIESLNVATATAIAAYEVRRQEWAAEPASGTDPPAARSTLPAVPQLPALQFPRIEGADVRRT